MRFRRLTLGVGLGSAALIGGALGAIILTGREGPQPKGSECLIVSALCPVDGGERYIVLTVAADPLDAGSAEETLAMAHKRERGIEQATGCTIADYIQDLDGGACAAQPDAMRRIDANPPHRCRCCTVAPRPDGGCPGTAWTRTPCVLLAGRQDKARDHGCHRAANTEEAP